MRGGGAGEQALHAAEAGPVEPIVREPLERDSP